MEKQQALVLWINTFPNVSKKCERLEDLFDGVQLGEALSQIIPQYLHADFIKKTDDNWIISCNNIKKIIGALDKYFTSLNMNHGLFQKLDANEIVKNKNIAQIQALVESLLTAAIESENKAEYISIILTLSEDCQKQLMLVIENALSLKNAPATSQNQDSDQIPILNATISELKHRINQLTADKNELTEDMKRLSDQMQAADHAKQQWKNKKKSFVDKIEILSKEIEQLQENEKNLQKTIKIQNLNLENKENDKKVVIDQLQKELVEREEIINKLKRKNTELEKENAIIKELRERLDVMNEIQAEHEQDKIKLNRLREKMLENKKIETAFNALQIKYDSLLSSSNSNASQLTELKQLNKSLASYKSQFADLESKCVQLEVSLSVKENEARNLQSLLTEKENENYELRNQNSTLSRELKQPKAFKSFDETHDSFEQELNQQILTPEMKQKLESLQTENENLQKQLQQQGASLDNLQEIQLQFDQSQSTVTNLLQQMNMLKLQLTQQLTENSELQTKIKSISANHHQTAPIVDPTSSQEYQSLLTQYNQLIQYIESQKLNQTTAPRSLEVPEPQPIPTPAVSVNENKIDFETKCKELQIQVDLLNSTLSALGLRYSGSTTIHPANAGQRLSILARARQAQSICQ